MSLQQPISTKPKIDIELLDEDFLRYLDLARNIMKDIKRSKDREIIASYIKKCCDLTEQDINVKANRNEFFKRFLKMLYVACANQPPYIDRSEKKPEDRIMKYWSPDKKTYISAKVMPGYGALIYMATSNELDKGWEMKGFRNYKV